LMQPKQAAAAVVNNNPNLIQANSAPSVLKMVLFIAFIVYMIGIIYKSYLLVRNLTKMYGFIKKSSKVKEENYWIVCLKSEIPAFSFFNYIFINNTYKNLSSDDLHVIKKHEMVHVKQYHTLDILFVELVGILFWLNPIVNYLKKSLKEIHEYIVDERIAGHGENKKAYAQLLLTLASDTKVFDLAASFTGEHIKRRILMIAKQRTSEKGKLTFIVIIPLTLILLLSFSYLGKSKSLDFRNTQGKFPWAIYWELQKYCGVYIPSKPGPVAMEIQLKNNTLVSYLVLAKFAKVEPVPGIPWTQNPANWTKEFQYVSDNKFADSSGYKSANIIEFVLNKENEVTGCLFTQREGLNFVTHEFKKQK
jgi:hypothetical protein